MSQICCEIEAMVGMAKNFPDSKAIKAPRGTKARLEQLI